MAKGKRYNPWVFKPQEDCNTLDTVYNYWVKMLFTRLMRLFIWDGLTFPQRELEYRYLSSGAVSVVNDANVGLMATWAALTGITQYTDIFTKVTYNAPTAKGGTLIVGKDAIYGYNTSTRLSLAPHVEYYASLLAHTYMSIKMALVNLRAQDVFSATDDNTRESIQNWHKGLYEGKMLAIFDNTLAELPTSIQQLSSNNRGVDLKDLMEVHNDILRNFYRDIGIRYAKEKKGNLVADEVTSDEQMLLYNIDDMLDCRRQLAEDYNNTFTWATPISVRLNPLFEVIQDSNQQDDLADGA